MPCARGRELDLNELYRQPGSPECRAFDAHCEVCPACLAERERWRAASATHRARGWQPAPLALLAAVIAVALILWWGSGRDDPSSGDPHGPERAAPGEAGPLALHSGETLELAAESLPREGSLVLRLLLPEPTDATQPLPVRILAEDGRVLETSARVDANDRRRTEVEVAGAWLAPRGRYIFELETTERTHLPLRRYAVETR